MIGFLIALLSGALMSIQGVLTHRLRRQQECGSETAGYSLRLLRFVLRCGFLPEEISFTAYGSTAEIYAVRRCDSAQGSHGRL